MASVAPPPPPPPGSMTMPPPSPIDPRAPAAERSGLLLGKVAALAMLIGVLMVFVAPIALLAADGITIHTLGIHFGNNLITIATLELLLEIIVAGVGLVLVSVVIYLLSFVMYRRVQPGFTTPMVLTIIGLLGVLLVIGGVVSFWEQLVSGATCAASGSGGAASSCISLSSLLAAIEIAILGLVLGFIGWIGLLIGIYRIGKRHGSMLSRVGAILLIFPALNFIGTILIAAGMMTSHPTLSSGS